MKDALIAVENMELIVSLNAALGRAGYRVSVTTNTAEALNRLLIFARNRKPFDAVIVDMKIPGFSVQRMLELMRGFDLYMPAVVIAGTNDYGLHSRLAAIPNVGVVEHMRDPYQVVKKLQCLVGLLECDNRENPQTWSFYGDDEEKTDKKEVVHGPGNTGE